MKLKGRKLGRKIIIKKHAAQRKLRGQKAHQKAKGRSKKKAQIIISNMPKKKEEKVEEVLQEVEIPVSENSEKDKLLALYQTLKDLGIRSISDLENLIARAE